MMLLRLDGIKQFALDTLSKGVEAEKTFGDGLKIKFEKCENTFLCVVSRKHGLYIDWFQVENYRDFLLGAKNWDLECFD